jgi:hypothetical protein
MPSDNYTRRRASTRGMRTRNQQPDPPQQTSAPIGPDGTTAAQAQMALPVQAQALRGPQLSDDVMSMIPNTIQDQLRAGYQAGGFEGVMKSVGDDWYNIPEHMRTQILAGVRK